MFRFLTLFLIIAILLLIITSSSSCFVAARAPSWTDAFESLVAVFKDSPRERSALVDLMFHTSARDLNYADTLCSRLDFVQCIGVEGSSKGSSAMPAWPLRVAVRGATDFSKIRISALPANVLTLQIEFAEAPVDIARLVAEIPGSVLDIDIESSGIITSSSSPQAPAGSDSVANLVSGPVHSFRVAPATLEAISITNCTVDDKFLTAGFLFAGIKRFSFVDGSIQSGGDIAALVGSFSKLQELRVVRADIQFKGQTRKQSSVGAPITPILTAISGNLATSAKRQNNGNNGAMAVTGAAATLKSVELEAFGEQQKLSSEMIDTLFEDIKQLERLRHLRLVNLALPRIPTSLSSALRSLHIVRCKLTGSLPDVSSYPSIEEVDFSGNELTKFPHDGDESIPRHVKRIRIAHNKITGPLYLDQMPRHFIEVNCSHNQMSGIVDFTRIGHNMAILDLSFNKFSGPVNLRELPDNLRVLKLNDCEFTGRYDVTKLPLLLETVAFGGNKWTSLMPPRRGRKKKQSK